MCGFVGFVGGTDNQSEVLTKMMDRIVHRGPDMGGQFIDGRVALGFRRLSILDLTEAGAQPMANEDGSVVIVVNGEIYNFQELRSELEAKGYKFHCGADTESLLHGYEEWGEAVLDRLRGMYAFVIWDKKKNKLFGARDIFGIKPLYYYPMADAGDGAPGVLFGSEIKSFLDYPHFHKAVNKKALRPYMTLQYSATEETFFEGVYKLPPAHYFTVDIPTGKMNIERYWDCDYSAVEKPFEEYVDELDEVVHESVEAHRIADVKVASFLSGGVDSSYIAACLMPDKTFSVGFDYKNFNETNYAKELSDKLGVENVRKMITADEFFGALEDIQYHMDEPQSNPSSVPLYFLCQLARQHVTVVLSGEGADEIYAGYEWYADTPLMQKYKHIPAPLRHLASDASQHLPYFKGHDFIIKGSGRPEDWFIGQAHVFEEKDAYDILRPKYRVGPTAREVAAPIYDRVKDLSELEKKQYLDLNLWLPGDILLKADKMSMAHSLELRVPYLDREVLREAQTYPDSYKLRGDTKAVLRTAANKTLPDAWANRTKKGFPVPIAKWLEDPAFSAKVRKSFMSDVAAEYFDQDKLVAMLADPKHERRKIWTAYTFLTWHEQFFEKFDA